MLFAVSSKISIGFSQQPQHFLELVRLAAPIKQGMSTEDYFEA
jgi:hypothetical protein